jgi:hypothetical protein
MAHQLKSKRSRHLGLRPVGPAAVNAGRRQTGYPPALAGGHPQGFQDAIVRRPETSGLQATGFGKKIGFGKNRLWEKHNRTHY